MAEVVTADALFLALYAPTSLVVCLIAGAFVAMAAGRVECAIPAGLALWLAVMGGKIDEMGMTFSFDALEEMVYNISRLRLQER